MDTGIDGMLIDAPLCYPSQTWEHNRRHITSVIASYGNTYIQAEGGRDAAWISDAGYNSIQDYGIERWDNKWQEDSILLGIESGELQILQKSF